LLPRAFIIYGLSLSVIDSWYNAVFLRLFKLV